MSDPSPEEITITDALHRHRQGRSLLSEARSTVENTDTDELFPVDPKPSTGPADRRTSASKPFRIWALAFGATLAVVGGVAATSTALQGKNFAMNTPVPETRRTPVPALVPTMPTIVQQSTSDTPVPPSTSSPTTQVSARKVPDAVRTTAMVVPEPESPPVSSRELKDLGTTPTTTTPPSTRLTSSTPPPPPSETSTVHGIAAAPSSSLSSLIADLPGSWFNWVARSSIPAQTMPVHGESDITAPATDPRPIRSRSVPPGLPH